MVTSGRRALRPVGVEWGDIFFPIGSHEPGRRTASFGETPESSIRDVDDEQPGTGSILGTDSSDRFAGSAVAQQYQQPDTERQQNARNSRGFRNAADNASQPFNAGLVTTGCADIPSGDPATLKGGRHEC